MIFCSDDFEDSRGASRCRPALDDEHRQQGGNERDEGEIGSFEFIIWNKGAIYTRGALGTSSWVTRIACQ